MKKLNPRQERFCHEYIVCGNGAEAYKRAYSVSNDNTARPNASKLLDNPAVQARLDELRAEVADAAIMNAKEIQERLTQIARRELYDEIFLPNGEQTRRRTSIRDSTRALELLAKIGGLFVTKAEVDLQGALPVVITDDV